LLSAVSDFKTEPHVVLGEDDRFVDAVPFKLKRYEGLKSKSYGSFNEALDEYFLKATAAEKAGVSVEVDKLTREAERLKRMVAEQEKALREDEKKAEHYRQIGDSVYAHSSEFQAFLDRFATAKQEGKDWQRLISEIMAAKKVKGDSFVESFDSRNLLANVCVDNRRFSLNLRRTLYENAAEYYERGKKAKQKASGALTALEGTRKKLAEAEQKMRRAEEQKTKPMEVMEELVKRKVKRKEWYEKFRWFTSSDGFLVVAGKDAVSNEVLVKKYTAQEDVVFHAEITGSPFVVIKAEGKPVSEQALKEASEAAASYSRAWRENAGTADVYWVKVDQLSKSGPSGESVPHGAFFVVGKRNWYRNTPLRVAIGICVGEETTFVGGPIDSVKAKTKTYAVVQPGNYQGKELLQMILRTLTAKLSKEQKERAGKTSIEQVREFVPYTKGTVNPKTL
jgi:predicted ribosome quality control (RQC) complex YloA/Tae2 family protein